jgi:hypothetical protein
MYYSHRSYGKRKKKTGQERSSVGILPKIERKETFRDSLSLSLSVGIGSWLAGS